jgi:DNA-binding CsgD family transcriptional regulator
MVKPSSSCIPLTDLSRVGRVLEVILRPDHAQDVDRYRRSVLDAVKELVGADAGAYIVHTGESASWTSDFPSITLGEYAPTMESTVPGVDIWARHIALGVHRRDEVWAPIRPDFYETPYFQDLLSAHRAFDSLGTTWRTSPGRGKENVVQLLVHHSSPKGPRFGAKEQAILGILAPALRSGLTHSMLSGKSPGDFNGSSESGTTGWLLLGPQGAILHANETARGLLSADDQAEPTITLALATLVGARRGGRPSGGQGAPVPNAGLPVIRVTIGGCPVDLNVTRTALNGRRGTGYLVSFTRPGALAPAPDFELLGRAKGLTPRQAQIAALLCKRMRSREIADVLGLKLNTVRRYEERLFSRLGIRRRTDVEAALTANE